jgi:hypothetical protein
LLRKPSFFDVVEIDYTIYPPPTPLSWLKKAKPLPTTHRGKKDKGEKKPIPTITTPKSVIFFTFLVD